jgi:NAD(P)-dependent dehydrogenase (short-subunit alcohol dehydrogenase family)
MLRMGAHTHLITCQAAIPVLLRTAAAQGTRGLVVEMTDGTSQANAEFRRNVGFYYDLVKANVERIVKGLAAELEQLPVTAVGVTPGWLRSEMLGVPGGLRLGTGRRRGHRPVPLIQAPRMSRR